MFRHLPYKGLKQIQDTADLNAAVILRIVGDAHAEPAVLHVSSRDDLVKDFLLDHKRLHREAQISEGHGL